MPEAVIVSYARSPIGRSGKGSLVDMRPDELAAHSARAVLDQIPSLERRELGLLPDAYIAMGQTAGNVAQLTGVTRTDQGLWTVRSRYRIEKAVLAGHFDRGTDHLRARGRPAALLDGTQPPPDILQADRGARKGGCCAFAA